MRKIYPGTLAFTFGLVLQHTLLAQCGASLLGGSASNMFTQIRNSTNPVAADKNLNSIVFIHRNNASAFSGNSGNLRYDVSTNGGSTWSADLGVLNPVNSSQARYPNVAIYNPTLNTTPSNAYISYMAATINNASAWNGLVSGVRQLSGSGNTENYNQPAQPADLIPHSIVKGAPGIFWAVDAQYNGTNITGFSIYKGTWSSATSDIGWVTNYTVTPPFNTGLSSVPIVGDYNIAFDPTGTIGWMSFAGQVTPGPTSYNYYPVFYKTTNGGTSWTGPIQIDLTSMSCLAANMSSGYSPSTNYEQDLVVDMNGNPHLFTTVGNGMSYGMTYTLWHHMYDITQVNGVWTAYDVANVNGGPGSWGVSPNIATQMQAPQAARTADGSKVFFTWSDNAAYSLGTANTTPDLFGKAYNVVTHQWTNVKNFTSCNAGIAGKILFPHLAEEVLEPVANTYKLATIYGEFTAANDPIQVANFRFLDNVTFSNTDFSIPQSTLAVTIVQGNSVIACPNSSLTININGGNFESVLWSNGVANNYMQTNTPGQYIVTAMAGCNIGMDTIAVVGLTATASVSTPTICAGNQTTLSATGNAYSYSWTPGSTSNTAAVVSPTATTVYSLNASGDQACVYTRTVLVTVNPAPTLSITGSSSVCAGSAITQTASGAVSYTWTGFSPGASVSITPSVSGVYTVAGTGTNACVGMQTVSIAAVPLPTVSFVATRSVICRGETTTLTANGGNSYTVTNGSFSTTVSGSSNNNMPFGSILSPTVTGLSTYSAIATNSTGCSNMAQLTLSVSACAGIESLAGEPALKLNIYPNPSGGEFFIQTPVDIQLSIINETGQLVKTLQLNSSNQHQVTVKELSAGIYFVVGQYNGQAVKQKIVIVN